MNKPSILYLCDYQAPYGGNFIASMVKLDAVLHEKGAETIYAFPAGAAARGWYEQMTARGFHLFTLAEGNLFAKARQLLHVIDDNHVTILHVHFGLFPLAELVALLRPKCRLLLHFHSDFSAGRKPSAAQRLRDALKRAPEAMLGRRLTKITVSERSARTTDDCVRIHNALVPERFAASTWTREQTRTAFRVPDTATMILSFGWSPYIKGIDVAVRAVKRIIDSGHRHFVLGVICGREYTQARLCAFIRERTDCTGDEPWLLFLPPEEDVFRYHKASDIMLSASRSETFSYALLEAIASGKPCVASDIPGVRWAEAFDTVRFFPTGDDSALSDALLALDNERNSDGFTARLDDACARAKQDFGIDEWIAGMCSVYGLD